MKRNLLLLMIVIFDLAAFAQVGIGTENPEGVLDVVSSEQGVLVPRIVNPETDILEPDESEFVYDTTEQCFRYYTGTEWSECITTNSDSGGNATINSVAVLGPLELTTDEGRTGYHTVITTPDGRFSVRCFVPQGTAFSFVNLQIRNNSETTTDITSNGTWLWGGAGGYTHNQLRLPSNVRGKHRCFTGCYGTDRR